MTKKIEVKEDLKIYVTEEMRAQIEFVLQRYYNDERMRLQRNAGLNTTGDRTELQRTESALVRVKEAYRG